ncbi:hypothetical protein [Motiliproteus sp. MSK22-1]|uniref:hypothetical protein n=1 Tax=Motiliproteus sp. MSK22-1 TaxID=1897630 RepID=UPI0009766BD5|nr:hypothetical protein [Motiliproteus sp. MSK22-1]OMH38840.1 hypothetical protein BGP75_00220 [Motiliproteus sp. MSK22-1]
MKRLPTKAQIRTEIEDQVEEFLKQGGEVLEVKTGSTGLVNGELNTNNLGFGQPRQQRTPVQEAIIAIEKKRQSKLATNKPKKPKPAKPQKRVIYDDFGEPVRVVWE